MQLSARVDDEGWESAPARPPPEYPAVRDYEARRCHVCQARHPVFGFGAPLTQSRREIWACSTHRAEVTRLLHGDPGTAVAPAPQLSPL